MLTPEKLLVSRLSCVPRISLWGGLRRRDLRSIHSSASIPRPAKTMTQCTITPGSASDNFSVVGSLISRDRLCAQQARRRNPPAHPTRIVSVALHRRCLEGARLLWQNPRGFALRMTLSDLVRSGLTAADGGPGAVAMNDVLPLRAHLGLVDLNAHGYLAGTGFST